MSIHGIHDNFIISLPTVKHVMATIFRELVVPNGVRKNAYLPVLQLVFTINIVLNY